MDAFHWRRNRGVWGDNVPPTFEAKGVQGGTMKTIYVFQFRLYSCVRINISYMNQANGCYANSFFFAYFLYAYDNMLLSPSVLGLQSIHHSADVVFCFTPGLKSTYLFHKSYPPPSVVSLLPPGLPPRIFAWIVSSELLGVWFYSFLIFRFWAVR